MPLRSHHDLRHCHDVIIRNRLVKKVAHRIDEDHFRCTPAHRFRKFFRDEPQIETLLIRVTFHTSEPLCERLSVAMLTARADLRTTPHWIPGSFCPFDSGVFSTTPASIFLVSQVQSQLPHAVFQYFTPE